MFKQAFARRRCLVPSDWFYEWKKLDAKSRLPTFVHFPGHRLFAFADLWERWRPREETEPVDTCTVVTTTPNALLAPIHDRMPVILSQSDYDRWLDYDTEPADAAALLRPFAGEMVAEPVGKHVNNPRNDGPACAEAWA